MATPKKEKLQVVEKSTDEVKIIPQNSSTQVTVAVHLPHGIMFDDVPVKGGGRTGKTSSVCTAKSVPSIRITVCRLALCLLTILRQFTTAATLRHKNTAWSL